MYLSEYQIDLYRTSGFIVLESLFSAEEMAVLADAYVQDCAITGPHQVMEEGGRQIRAVYASHARTPEFADLVRSTRLLGAVQQLLSEKVYVYQFKINAKPPFISDGWAWHQDYAAWKAADQLPSQQLVNAALFLDDVTEFNGPLIFVPGSHRSGLVREGRSASARSEQHLDPDDIALRPEQVEALVRQSGMVSPKGPAGSVVFFHPELVHGSAPNMSPFQRKLLLVTYNDVSNVPLGAPRPEYIVGRDTTPLELVDGPITRAELAAA